MRILICDDEKDITDMLERYFVKKGYEVLTANNGEAAIKKAEKNPNFSSFPPFFHKENPQR